MSPDPYEILGVAPSASATEIRAAYLALIRKHHPDLAFGADAEAARRRTSEINAAFHSLRQVPKNESGPTSEIWPGSIRSASRIRTKSGLKPRYSASQRLRRIRDVRRFHLLITLGALLMLGAAAWLTWQLIGRSL